MLTTCLPIYPQAVRYSPVLYRLLMAILSAHHSWPFNYEMPFKAASAIVIRCSLAAIVEAECGRKFGLGVIIRASVFISEFGLSKVTNLERNSDNG